MVKIRRPLWTIGICFILAAAALLAQTTLTQVQGTVTNSDGSPFNGTIVITWNGTTGANTGTAPLSTSARIYSGALSVLLVPTTTASAGSFYQVVYYNASGVATWSETWQVSPSTTPLALSAAITSTSRGPGGGTSGGGSSGGGTSTGSQYATLPISINQITGLSADLASINSALASLQAQPSGGSGSAVASNNSFVDNESLTGTLDGTNAAFALSQTPVAGSLSIYRNGLLQTAGVDYTLTGNSIAFFSASIPRATDVMNAYYRVPGTTVTFVDAEIPAGTIDGSNTSFRLAGAPNPVLSLKLYKNGVLLNQNGDFTLSGSTITFASAATTPQTGDILVASYRR